MSLLVEQCGVLGAKNLSTLVNGSDEGNPAAAEAFVEQVAELLCPNDCTLNGKCINGSCVCYEEYTASDCSMSIYQKPEIYRYSVEHTSAGLEQAHSVFWLILF